MAFFRTFPEVTPILRIFDDAALSAARRRRPGCGARNSVFRPYYPPFDIREVGPTYELQGELPGVKQEDISMQWDDPQTLTIRGRTQRRRDSTQQAPAPQTPTAGTSESEKSRQATVEDDFETVEKEDAAPGSPVAQSTTSTATPAAEESAEKPIETDTSYVSYERSVGSFSRSWKFPTRIDQDNVKASLRDGILSVHIPKAKETAPRKINIE